MVEWWLCSCVVLGWCCFLLFCWFVLCGV